MATERQIEANRLNAQKSTGPRTPEGKAAVRFNALKHGLDAGLLVIPGEDPEELDALIFEYYEQFRPETPVSRYLVDTLVQCDWSRRRLSRLEANIITALSGEEPSGPLARADRAALGSAPLDRVFRQLNALERQYFRALAELRRLPEQPPAAEIGFVPQESVGQPAAVGLVANRPGSSQEPPRVAIGFVPPVRRTPRSARVPLDPPASDLKVGKFYPANPPTRRRNPQSPPCTAARRRDSHTIWPPGLCLTPISVRAIRPDSC